MIALLIAILLAWRLGPKVWPLIQRALPSRSVHPATDRVVNMGDLHMLADEESHLCRLLANWDAGAATPASAAILHPTPPE